MTTIEKIKTEIERLRDENRKIKCLANERYCSGYDDAFYDLVPFIDTIESEKPMNQRGFEEEMDKYVEENGLVNCSEIVPIARHFYEIGCRRTAEKYDEIEYNRQRAEENIPNDLEEAAKKHFKQEWNENYWAFEGDAINTFIAGAKWDREQMMKEAVEGEVYKLGEVAYVKEHNNTELTKYLSQFDNGDKVCIIIVKED